MLLLGRSLVLARVGALVSSYIVWGAVVVSSGIVYPRSSVSAVVLGLLRVLKHCVVRVRLIVRGPLNVSGWGILTVTSCILPSSPNKASPSTLYPRVPTNFVKREKQKSFWLRLGERVPHPT